jgi:hypothetical protein
MKRTEMSSERIKKRLDEIAQKMREPGADLEKLSEEIDRLLGTELPPEDVKYLTSKGRRVPTEDRWK